MVSGKKKNGKGAVQLQPEQVIGHIMFNDGSKEALRCGVKGSLIEYNARLVGNPQLIFDEYLLIVQPAPEKKDKGGDKGGGKSDQKQKQQEDVDMGE